jgi:hypothetical protein
METMSVADYLAQVEKPKHNKYNAMRCMIDGYVFDSKAEAARYVVLRAERDSGHITDLRPHPKPAYVLIPAFKDNAGKKHQAVRYTPDFEYRRGDKLVIEDVKGGKATMTPVFRIKEKLFRLQHPDIIFEIIEAA